MSAHATITVTDLTGLLADLGFGQAASRNDVLFSVETFDQWRDPDYSVGVPVLGCTSFRLEEEIVARAA